MPRKTQHDLITAISSKESLLKILRKFTKLTICTNRLTTIEGHTKELKNLPFEETRLYAYIKAFIKANKGRVIDSEALTLALRARLLNPSKEFELTYLTQIKMPTKTSITK